MQGSGEAYRQLLQRLEEALPEVARQIREEVARGRVVTGSKLPAQELKTRAIIMDQENLTRIRKTDIVSVDYNDDERLALLISSIIRLASTMEWSRKAVAELGANTAHEVIFENPDGSERIEFSISQDLNTISEVAASVDSTLRPALDELGGTP